jgi:hypothetical protein
MITHALKKALLNMQRNIHWIEETAEDKEIIKIKMFHLKYAKGIRHCTCSSVVELIVILEIMHCSKPCLKIYKRPTDSGESLLYW